MSEKNEERPREVAGAPKVRPSHIAYQVDQGSDEKSYFSRVGAAFAHRDGQGFNVKLKSFPVDGQIVLRAPKDRLEATRSDSDRSHQQRTHHGDRER
ncbi:MAG: hypothetical protein AAGI89_09925 [Pseudomonadota bacterium]